MQVTFNPIKQTISKQTIKIHNHQNTAINTNNNSFQLANFNSIGKSLVSFRGTDEKKMDLSKKTIAELEELKKLRTEKREKIEEKKKDAQAKLDAIKKWDYQTEFLKQKNDAEAEINAKDLSRFWNPFQCSDIRQKHFNNFHRRNSEINAYKSRETQYKDLVEMAPLSDDEAQEFIASIDAMIEQKLQIEAQNERLRGIEGVKAAIENMNNARGGLDDRIAGYDYEKDEIRRVFISPLAESQNNPEIKVPSSVMLYGASGTGKTTFLYGLKQEAEEKGYARVIPMPAVDDSDEFMDTLKREFNKARTLYWERGDDDKPKKIRTVLLFNDAEQYFGMSYEQAKKVYGDLIDEADADKLQNLHHDPKLINNFKSILDSCSGIPRKDAPYGTLDNSAVTIFITTNYPHLIDRDLIRKFDLILPVNPAKNGNFEEVVKYYFKKCSDVLTEVKKTSKNSNFRAKDLTFLNSYLSKKSINKLVKMAEDGTIEQLTIDCQKIPYDKIAKDFNPSKLKGAFDNMQLRDLAIAALNDYIEEPERLYSAHYYARLFNEPRKLDPVRYKHFVDIFNTLAPLNKQEEIDPLIMQRRQKEILLGLEKIGQLSEKDKKQLEYIRTQEQQELNYLEYKEKEETLSQKEKERLDDIRKSRASECIEGTNVDEDADY